MTPNLIASFSFPAPAERFTKNQRLHHYTRARLTKHWRLAAKIAALNWANATNATRPLPPAILTVTFDVPNMRRRDADGPSPTVAAIQDGLVDAGFWPDDTPEWVTATGSRFTRAERPIVAPAFVTSIPYPVTVTLVSALTAGATS